MADLTSTISISGTVGTKTISFTHTYTLEDVIDAGTYSADGNIGTGGIIKTGTGGGDAEFRPDEFSYCLAYNISQYPASLQLIDSDAGITVPLYLLEGQFLITMAIAAGMFTYNVTATTSSLHQCEQVIPDNSPPTSFKAPCSIMVATLAAS